MEITDEIIGCFIEGTATPDERICVREYLCAHPEENEHILCLMDKGTVDFPGEHFEAEEECLYIANGSFSDMDCCEVAFMPEQCMDIQPGVRNNRKEKISSRLSKLWDELDM